MKIKKVFIFGSCVSRDPFGDLSVENLNFNIVDYYARSSLASVFSQSPSFDIDCSKIASPFQRKMVERDISKSFFEDLENANFDLLLVDFTDDRFCLMEFPDGSRITESEELGRLRRSNTNLIPLNTKFIKPFSDEYFEIWSAGWFRLFDYLNKSNQLNKLLINKVFWATCDDDNLPYDDLIRIRYANSFFDKVYKFISDFLEPSQFIKYDNVLLVGGAAHRWGRAPYHFSKDIENFCLDYINAL